MPKIQAKRVRVKDPETGIWHDLPAVVSEESFLAAERAAGSAEAAADQAAAAAEMAAEAAVQRSQAALSAEEAEGHSLDAEAYGTGARGGEPVESGDAAYENNAKYWSEQSSGYADDAADSAEEAEAWATGGTGGTPGAENNAEYWSGQAEAAAESVSASAAQIETNRVDIGNLKRYNPYNAWEGMLSTTSSIPAGTDMHFDWHSDTGTWTVYGTSDIIVYKSLFTRRALPENVKPGQRFAVKYKTSAEAVRLFLRFYDALGNGMPYELYRGDRIDVVPEGAAAWGLNLQMSKDVTIPEETPVVVSDIRFLTRMTDEELEDEIRAISPMSADEIAALSTLLDMPVNRTMWVSTARLTELVSTVSEDDEYPAFPGSGYYLVRSYYYSGSYKAFEVLKSTGAEHYFATTASDRSTLRWRDRSWDGLDGRITKNAGDIAGLKQYNAVDLFAGNLKRPSAAGSLSHGVRYSWDGDGYLVRNDDLDTPSDDAGLYAIIDKGALPGYITPGESYDLDVVKTEYIAEGDPEDGLSGWNNVSIQIGFWFDDGTPTQFKYYFKSAKIEVPANAIQWKVSLYVASNRTVSCKINTYLFTGLSNRELTDIVRNVKTETEENDAIFEFYSEFEELPGWYTGHKGTVSYKTDGRYFHTQLLKIRPNTDYYTAYVPNNNLTVGAFFDTNGNFLRSLYHNGEGSPGDDYTEITPVRGGGANTYEPSQHILPGGSVTRDGAAVDDPSTSLFPASSYITLYKFTSPEDAAYVSINLASTVREPTSTSPIQRYRNAICSKPIFMPVGTGDIVIRAGDPIWHKYKDKKLCVIGPSTVAINRLRRQSSSYPGFVNPGGVYQEFYNIIEDPANKYYATSGYIAGCEEYLKPYFADARTFGFSGASMEAGLGANGKPSIQIALCGGSETYSFVGNTYVPGGEYAVEPSSIPDLSGYNVFLITSDANGLRSTKTYADTEAAQTQKAADEAADLAGYMTALRAICEKIYTDNPYAEIYLMNFSRRIMYDIHYTLNTEIKKYSEEISCNLIDITQIYQGCRDGMTITDPNTHEAGTWTPLSYDDQHRNNEGNRLLGLAMRKAIMGF